jgi:hypothetical protein
MGLEAAASLAWSDVASSYAQEVEEDSHRSLSRVIILPPRPSVVTSCVGEFGNDGRLFGLGNIESLNCLLLKPCLLSWTSSSVGFLLVVTQDIDEEDAHRCMFRVAILPPRPSLVCGCLGEFGDGGLLLGLSNIESLHVLLPKTGLLAGFIGEAGYWTMSVGSFFLVHSRSPSQRFFFSFVSVFKSVGEWKSFIPIVRLFMFRRLSEGNLDASWTMDTLATSTLPATPARRPARKGERLLVSIEEVFMFSRLLSEHDPLGTSWTTDTLATSTLPITLGRRSARKRERLLVSIAVSLYEC